MTYDKVDTTKLVRVRSRSQRPLQHLTVPLYSLHRIDHKIKTMWLSQQRQKKLLTKFNVHSQSKFSAKKPWKSVSLIRSTHASSATPQLTLRCGQGCQLLWRGLERAGDTCAEPSHLAAHCEFCPQAERKKGRKDPQAGKKEIKLFLSADDKIFKTELVIELKKFTGPSTKHKSQPIVLHAHRGVQHPVSP